jgi:hypothetical protein
MTGANVTRAYVALFVVSTAFPLTASLMPATAVENDGTSRRRGCAGPVLVATGVYIVSAKTPTTPENDWRAIACYKVIGTVPLVLRPAADSKERLS